MIHMTPLSTDCCKSIGYLLHDQLTSRNCGRRIDNAFDRTIKYLGDACVIVGNSAHDLNATTCDGVGGLLVSIVLLRA